MSAIAIDPILLEVLRNRLDAIADEMELTLLKSAASPIVKEGLDASAALFNVHGETIAQAAAIPIHLGALQFAAQRIVRAFPPGSMREGDAFLLNDPYDGGTHLPDITLAVPVVFDDHAVALACTMCHHQDVGGRTPGSVPTDAPSSTRRASSSRPPSSSGRGSWTTISSRSSRAMSGCPTCSRATSWPRWRRDGWAVFGSASSSPRTGRTASSTTSRRCWRGRRP